MTWFKVDDGLPKHRKVLSIPRGPRRLAAIGAWTLVGAWVSGEEEDGHFPATVLEELAIGPKVVEDLLASGLWRKTDSGYEMHDYLGWNPSAEKLDEKRAAAAERQRRAREAAKRRRDALNKERGDVA